MIDGEIWGRGACDLKGGICAALGGLRLLQKAGYRPAGGLSFAFIGDEESGEPGTGVSAGAHDLVKRVKDGTIAKPDFAVYVEPTRLDVYTAQIGFFIADITITGKSAYFGTPELGVDALKATHAILGNLWQHEAELAAGPKHDLVGASSILVTHINGGGYIAVPGECKLSLIRKLRPGENLDEAVAAFEAVVRSAPVADGIGIGIAYPAGRDHRFGGSPVEISRETPPPCSCPAASRSPRTARTYPAAPSAAHLIGRNLPFLSTRSGVPRSTARLGTSASHTHSKSASRWKAIWQPSGLSRCSWPTIAAWKKKQTEPNITEG